MAPNGKFKVTVTGQKKSLEGWVTVEGTEGPIRVWPIERSVYVLWRPDSRAFALTDNHSNGTYVLVIGTQFHMSGPKLGVRRVNLTPVIRKAFQMCAQRYYGTTDYDIDSLYAKALRWSGNTRLLVVVSSITVGPPRSGAPRGVKDWDLTFLVDVQHINVLRSLNGKAGQSHMCGR